MPVRDAEDNCRMNSQRDLLPWIFGGLSTAAGAIALTAISSQRTATPAAQPIPVVAVAPQRPTPAAVVPTAVSPTAVAGPAAENTPAPSIAATDTGAQSEARPGQIWACTTNGVKTFSNNPCGKNSSLLEVGPINTMNAAMPV